MNEETITLTFDLDDIDALYHTSHRSFYFKQIDRFESMKDLPVPFEKDEGNYIHYMDGFVNALLFTKILKGFGYKAYMLNDLEKEDHNEYAVLTDYAGKWSYFDEG